MNIILFDEPAVRANLLPFTYTRPVAEIRCGILTIREKWERLLPATYSWLTAGYLSGKFLQQQAGMNLYVNGCVLPDKTLVDAIKSLKTNQILVYDDLPVAFYGNVLSWQELDLPGRLGSYEKWPFSHEIKAVRQPYDIFVLNGAAVRSDFQLLTEGRKSAVIDDPHTVVYGAEHVFVEEGAVIRASVLSAEEGVLYIGAKAVVSEGTVIRSGPGGTAICDNATVNPAARILGDTTVGPFCKVGGEIHNSVMFGYSNKAHDGFMGNTVVGEWCNFGADSNTSNLKNDYKKVKVWNYAAGRFLDTGLQFCGLMMGDHSKCGINSMLNAGTVVGVSANIHGSGYPRAFVPSFSNGGPQGFSTYPLRTALRVAGIVYGRRNKTFDEVDSDILEYIFEVTKKYRPA